MNRLVWEPITLRLRNPFRISHGTSETRLAHWLRLSGPASADEGWGEGTIPPHYGVSTVAMAAFWDATVRRPAPLPDDPTDIPAFVGSDGPAPARAALDLALHDRLGKLHDKPLHALLGLPVPRPLPTSFTPAIDEPEAMGRSAAAADPVSRPANTSLSTINRFCSLLFNVTLSIRVTFSLFS